MTLQLPTDGTDRPTKPPRQSDHDVFLVVVVGLAIALLAAVIVLLVADGNDDGTSSEPTTTASTDGASATSVEDASTVSGPTTSTDEGASTSSIPTSTGSTTSSSSATTGTQPPSTSPTPVSGTVWPLAGSATRYPSPDDAARGFAEELVGFEDPILGAFRPGDSRSGEIELRPRASGPLTTILLRQASSDDSWWVIGSVSENIVIDQPSASSAVGDRFELSGRARAFEGTVQYEVYGAGGATIASGFVTGSGDGTLGPFSTSVDVAGAPTGSGILMLFTVDQDDGRPWDVTAIPITLG